MVSLYFFATFFYQKAQVVARLNILGLPRKGRHAITMFIIF